MKFFVNGQDFELDVQPNTMLIDVLRTHLGLTGTKVGCGEGQCGACTVLVDGKPVRSCVFPAERTLGKPILTIEGLAASWGSPFELHPLQQAFIEHGAVQCGFCTPGMLMAATSLWNKLIDPTEDLPPITDRVMRNVLGRNVCRCTGYASVMRAFRSAIHEYETGRSLLPMTLATASVDKQLAHSWRRPDMGKKVTGETRFVDDLSFPDMLVGVTLRSPYPHARLLVIDTDAARKVPGVHAVMTSRDVPGENRHGLVEQDWPVLCDEKVRYLGDAVALVAAETEESALRAIDLVRVEYDPLPIVNSPEDAMAVDAPPLHESRSSNNLYRDLHIRLGSTTHGFALADEIVEREYKTSSCDHMFIEPECSIGIPAGFDRHPKLTVYTGTQRPDIDRIQIAKTLGLDCSDVRVIAMTMGGAFGGKQDIMGQIHAALLAWYTDRPVKIRYTREESMLVHPKRHATAIRYKTGMKRDGTLTAVELEIVADAGAYSSLSRHFLEMAVEAALGPYDVNHVRIDAVSIFTNNPPAGGFYGSGPAEVAFAAEQNLDILAQKLDIDPFELRRKNAAKPLSFQTGGGQHQNSGLLGCLDLVEKEIQAAKEKVVSDDGSDRNTKIKSAWGVAAAFRKPPIIPKSAKSWLEVRVFSDGTVSIFGPAAGAGQGLSTILCQIVALELGLPIDRVEVAPANAEYGPNLSISNYHQLTTSVLKMVRESATSMRKRIVNTVAKRWRVPPESLRLENGIITHTPKAFLLEETDRAERSTSFAQVVRWLLESGQDTHTTSTRTAGKGHEGDGENHMRPSFMVQAAEVSVNVESGRVRVLRLVSAADIGQIMNMQKVLGQIEGGAMIGIGQTLTEEYALQEGVPLSRRWSDYRVPLIHQMPEMTVLLMDNVVSSETDVVGGLGGLASVPTAAAINNAIHRAIGVRTGHLPFKAVSMIHNDRMLS